MELKEALKAGDEITIQIAPFGEYPATTVDGKEIVERFDGDSFQKIIDNWKNNGEKMIRADFDHASEMTDNTIASGWIKDLILDNEKGLMGTLVVSDAGANSLNGLDYRFGSPVFELDETGHPVNLLSFAFTNRPRLKEMDAVWNCSDKIKNNDVPEKDEEKDGNDDGNDSKEEPVETKEEDVATVPSESYESSEQDEVKDEEKIEVNTEQPKESKMEEIKVILGLPDEATDEDIVNSVKEIVEKLKAIADEEIADEAEEIVNECGVDEEKKEEVVNCYKQNPALVKTVLNCFKKAPAKMVINSEDASKPELTNAEKLQKEFESIPGGQAKVDFLLKHGKSYLG